MKLRLSLPSASHHPFSTTQNQPRRREQGSILFISLSAMLIIGLALLVFMTLGMNQNQLIVHAQVWNASMPMAEAGVEDALNHCSWNSGNWASSGWLLSSSNTFDRSNSFSEGWYRTVISTNSLASNYITITSSGYFPMPGSSACVPRTVQVMAMKVPSYTFAIYAKAKLNFNGNGIRIDSYDSRDPAKSTYGLYDPSKATDKADIATYNGTPNANYNIGNGNIWGHVYMGAGGTVTCGANGKVGDAAWQTSGPKSGVEPGWLRNDLNISIPDVTLPFTVGLPPLTGIKIGGITYDYVFTSGTYVTPTITGNAIVTGNAIIYVTGNLNCSEFRLQTNTTATLYCGGSVHFSDSDNQTQRAANFEILGLSTCKSLDLDDGFMGAVYAPYASLSLNGNKEIYGSVCANTITFKGGSDLRYDEALRDLMSSGNKRGYIITSWKEL